MKKLLLALCFSAILQIVTAQNCNPNFRTLGTAPNVLGMLNSRLNVLSYDSTTRSLLCIHRNNNIQFGGSSGNLRYDISSDTGTTWLNDQGLLNPLQTLPARYPQVVNFHPSGGSNPNNNYAVYYAPTLSGTLWSGYVSGVRKLNNTGNTENYNQAGVTNTLIPGGLCEGGAGIFWTVDVRYNSNTLAPTGLRVLRGTWNGTDVTWAVNTTLTPSFNTSYDGNAHIADWNIAFDQSGNNGWIVMLTHLSGTLYSYKPVFYRTTNAGVTWTGPTELDLTSFPAVVAINASGYLPCTAFQVDLAVDRFGHPHALMTIGSGDGTNYSITTSNQMAMFDINFNGTNWQATNLSTLFGLRGTVGNSGQNTTHDNEPQVSRSRNGDVLVFLWCDTYGGLGGVNDLPNLYGMMYNASANAYGSLLDLTSCSAYAGQIFYPRASPLLISKGNGLYKIPVVFSSLNITGNENDPVTIHFIDNMYVAPCTAYTPVIVPSGPTTFCTGGSVSLSLSGSYSSYAWSNGATTSSINVATSGNYSVVVTNGSGCSGTSAATVVSVINAPAISITAGGSTQFCKGLGVTLNASGNNINSYQWKKNNSNVNGATNASYNASGTANFTCVGTNGCGSTTSNTIATQQLATPTPVVTPAGTVTMCAGDTTTLTANAAAGTSYQWYRGANALSGATALTYKVTIAGNYKVKETKNSTGCSKTSAATQVSITCKQENDGVIQAVSIYPNPTTGIFQLHVNEDWMKIEITDLLGQKVFQLDNSAQQVTGWLEIDLTNHADGIYLVTVYTPTSELSTRLILSK